MLFLDQTIVLGSCHHLCGIGFRQSQRDRQVAVAFGHCELRDRDMNEAVFEVGIENFTGAFTPYQDLGFLETFFWTKYSKELT